MLNIPKELDFLILHSSPLSELITPRRILSISSKYCIHHLEFFPVSKCYRRYTVLFIQNRNVSASNQHVLRICFINFCMVGIAAEWPKQARMLCNGIVHKNDTFSTPLSEGRENLTSALMGMIFLLRPIYNKFLPF